ncbi:MAG: hypothetical protein OIN86_04725 [Candidatus Methanoperedens sp.]|nr:hypothetical protein [Candidatus Methanoperedens sp.]CAG0996955.1 hypothetical protein METP1_02629 [Methanosarcinales archaeon]
MYNKNIKNKLLMMVFVIFLTIPLSSAASTTVVISPSGAGTVTVTSPIGTTTVTSTSTITVSQCAQVTYKATANSGFAFNRFDNVWGSKSETVTQNPWTDAVCADDTVTAVFVPVPNVNTGPFDTPNVNTPVPTPNVNTGPFDTNTPVIIKTRTVSIGEKLLTDLWNMLISIFYK